MSRTPKNILYAAALVILIMMVGSVPIQSAELLKTYQGTLTPPSDKDWQQMLQDRQTRHACMQKSVAYQGQLKLETLSTITEPTSNQTKFDVTYYKINLTLNFASNTISGFVEAKVKSLVDGLTMVDLNFTTTYGSLVVSSISLNGNPITNYNHTADLLNIYLGQTFNTGQEFTLKIQYGGTAGTEGDHGLFFYDFYGTEVCYTNCEPWGARLWWPCKDYPLDKPDSLDMIITHPSGNTLVSNGIQISSINNGNGTTTTRWHEKYPIATYLVQLGCTDYILYSGTWQYAPGHSMPVQNYSYPGIPSSEQWYSLYYMINYTNPALEALSSYFTLYPFVDEKYGHNHYGWNGAMEHQTLTSISPFFNSEYVIAHELAHQWGGDLVTCANFHHVWLNEGFASYAEPLYFRYHYGESYFKSWLQSQKHLDAGTPYVEDLLNDDIFDVTTVYDKASWVYYMLNMVMGDSLFFEAMDHYFNSPLYKYKSAYTTDLEQACEDVYGSELGWFFSAWIYQPGNPNYVYSYKHEADTLNGGYNMYLLIRQSQSYLVFPMPIEVNVYAGGFDTTFTVFDHQRTQAWSIHIPNPPDSVFIDKNEKILRTVEYDPNFRMSMVITKEVDTAYIGQPYYAEYQVIAGVPEYTWRKISGQFPYGLTFHSGNPAYFDGTPNWIASYVFTLEVQDSDVPPAADTQTLKIVVLEPAPPQKRGDCNEDGSVNVSDAVYLINYVFAGGAPPDPLAVGDVNCDGAANVSDAVYIINYVFAGGSPPCPW